MIEHQLVAVERARGFFQERIAIFEEQQRRDRERREQEALRQKQVQERAQRLLLENLDEEQRKAWLESQHFYFTTPSGNRYEISKGSSHNVYLVDDTGKRVASFCAHPNVTLPPEDVVLAQKLSLEFNEDHFISIANRNNLY